LADQQQDRKILKEAGQRLTRPFSRPYLQPHPARSLAESSFETVDAEARHDKGDKDKGQLTGRFVGREYIHIESQAVSGRLSMNVEDGTGSAKFTRHDKAGSKLGRPTEVAGVKVTGDQAIARSVERSPDGKTVRWDRQTVETFRVDPAKLSAIPQPLTTPTGLLARARSLFSREEPARPSAFDGVKPAVLAALRRGDSFTLERVDSGSAQQSMPSLPRAERPTTQYQRSSSYRIKVKSETDPIDAEIPEAAYNALRSDLATKVALTP
jgi:hypothetical protein